MLLTGCIRDPYDPAEPLFGDVAGDLPVMSGTDDLDYELFFPPIRNQLGQNCSAHGFSGSAYACAQASNTPIEEPSVSFLYAVALVFERPRQPLVDIGSSLRAMLKGVTDRSLRGGDAGDGAGWGLIPESLWPERVETLTTIPPDDCWRAGEYATLGGYSVIREGAGAADQVLAALRRGRFPTICLVVDQRFADLGSDVYVAPGGAVIGSHCMVAAGYSPARRAFKIRNSWGTALGDRGYFWVSRDYIDSAAYGMYAAEIVPPRLAA